MKLKWEEKKTVKQKDEKKKPNKHMEPSPVSNIKLW